jgi:flavin-dependent dehydrogenase
VEILVFGDDEGVGEAAAAIGARHIPDVTRNEYGTPLLTSLFEEAQRIAAHDVLGYINADIALLSDFLPAVAHVAERERSFLIGGQRWDIDMPDDWRIDTPDWENVLRAMVANSGRLLGPHAIDYFVFRRGLYPHVPPFAIGRTAWDNWLLLDAWRRGATVVDATAAITAIHFNHDYVTRAAGNASSTDRRSAKS